MNTHKDVIGYMKKITVSLEAGKTPDNMHLNEPPLSFQFIYGVGAEGVCLFEKALFEKQSGDEILLQVDPHQSGEIFGHLKQALINFLPMAAPFYLKTTITAIEAADNREIVQAIAKGTGSCDCECGCDGDCSG
jgi:hypothetical protein